MFDYSSLSLALVSTGISPWHTMKSYEVPIIPCYPRWKSSRIRPQARMRPQERAVLRAVRDEQRNVRKYGIARFNKRCPLLASALWLISGYSTIWWHRFRLHMGYIYIWDIPSYKPFSNWDAHPSSYTLPQTKSSTWKQQSFSGEQSSNPLFDLFDGVLC